MRKMKTTMIVPILTMYFQILSWNLKTSFYHLLYLDCPDQLLFLLKMTHSLSHLHILFDATKLRFRPPKTGFISRASWTSTPTMIPRAGPGVSFKLLMSLDSTCLFANPHEKSPFPMHSFIPHSHLAFLVLIFYLYSLANLEPPTQKLFLVQSPFPSSHCIVRPLILHDSQHPSPIHFIYFFLFQSSPFSEHKNSLAVKHNPTTHDLKLLL